MTDLDDGWRPVETAPERPERKYLAIDCIGYVHQTDHPRHVLMNAGWAVAWRPIPQFVQNSLLDRTPILDSAREIIGTHAREFKRLMKGHRLEGEIIDGVMLAPSGHGQ